MKKQIVNGSLYMIPVIIGNVLPILTIPIFTRILTLEEFGVMALAQVYALFVNGISNFGLTIGYERNFFENKDELKRAGLLFSTLLFVISTFILFGTLTYFFNDLISEWIIGNIKYSSLLFWSYCATGMSSLKTYFLIYFKNTENAKAFVWYTIDESLLGVSLSLFFLLYMDGGVLGVVLGPLVASSVIFLILCIRFIRELPFVFNRDLLRESLKISLPLTPRIFFGVIGNQFDKYMIGLLSTIGGVGIYNLGQKIANVVFTFMTAIQNIFAPEVYRRMFELDEKEGGISIGKYLTPFIYISIGGALVITLFSEEIIMLLTPKPYHGAIDVVAVLCMLFATFFFGKQPQLIYAKKTSVASWLTLIGIALNVIINIPFIKLWGVMGAAYGSLLAGLISGSISFIISQKYYEIKWEYEKIFLIYFSFFFFGIICMLLRHYGFLYELRLAFKLLFLAAFVMVGIRIKLVGRDKIIFLKKMIQSYFNVSK